MGQSKLKALVATMALQRVRAVEPSIPIDKLKIAVQSY